MVLFSNVKYLNYLVIVLFFIFLLNLSVEFLITICLYSQLLLLLPFIPLFLFYKIPLIFQTFFLFIIYLIQVIIIFFFNLVFEILNPILFVLWGVVCIIIYFFSTLSIYLYLFIIYCVEFFKYISYDCSMLFFENLFYKLIYYTTNTDFTIALFFNLDSVLFNDLFNKQGLFLLVLKFYELFDVFVNKVNILAFFKYYYLENRILKDYNEYFMVNGSIKVNFFSNFDDLLYYKFKNVVYCYCKSYIYNLIIYCKLCIYDLIIIPILYWYYNSFIFIYIFKFCNFVIFYFTNFIKIFLFFFNKFIKEYFIDYLFYPVSWDIEEDDIVERSNPKGLRHYQKWDPFLIRSGSPLGSLLANGADFYKFVIKNVQTWRLRIFRDIPEIFDWVFYTDLGPEKYHTSGTYKYLYEMFYVSPIFYMQDRFKREWDYNKNVRPYLLWGHNARFICYQDTRNAQAIPLDKTSYHSLSIDNWLNLKLHILGIIEDLEAISLLDFFFFLLFDHSDHIIETINLNSLLGYIAFLNLWVYYSHYFYLLDHQAEVASTSVSVYEECVEFFSMMLRFIKKLLKSFYK